MTHNCLCSHTSYVESSKFVMCVGKRSNDMNWFGQVAQQVADHEVLEDFRHSHGEMASVENSTGCVRF